MNGILGVVQTQKAKAGLRTAFWVALTLTMLLADKIQGGVPGDVSAPPGCLPAPDYLVEQFRTHSIVAIDEGPHGTIQTHQFLRALLRNDSVANTVHFLIVEFANTQYQSTLDRYINGESVPLAELQLVWRQTTQAHNPLFECPLYLALLNTVRTVNQQPGRTNKIRVLAGDPWIDWTRIKTTNDYFGALGQRDVFPSQLAIRYGIDSSRNVMVIFGGEHLSKRSDPQQDSTHWTIPYFIDRKYPGAVLAIGAANVDHDSLWSQADQPPPGSICDLMLSSAPPLQGLRDAFDAVYYVGPSNIWRADEPAKIDSVYWQELDRRSRIVWGDGIDTSLRR